MSDAPYDRGADMAARKQEVYIATRIESLLHDPEVEEALNGMLHGFQNSWLFERNPEVRETLWIKAQGLQEFINTLQELINTGKMAAAQLASMENGEDSANEE
jgi:hypothetical protein